MVINATDKAVAAKAYAGLCSVSTDPVKSTSKLFYCRDGDRCLYIEVIEARASDSQ